MQISFTKMEGAGNDFMVIYDTNGGISLTNDQIKKLSNRHLGVGFDQLLLISKDSTGKADFFYQIFNADGTESGQCGNGARCIMQYLYEKDKMPNKKITLRTKSGFMELRLVESGKISVDMGVPSFSPSDIPFLSGQVLERYSLKLSNSNINVGVVSIGNPHVVQIVNNIDLAPVETTGPEIEHHDLLPEGANAGFFEIVNKNSIKIRVWERGAGETLACGSGACAAAAIGIMWGLLTSPVDIETKGGKLSIEWPGLGRNIIKTGPARIIFDGKIQV